MADVCRLAVSQATMTKRSNWWKWGGVSVSDQLRQNLHATSSGVDDKHQLRPLFDSPAYWAKFRTSKTSNGNTGLVRNAYLTEPKGLLLFAQAARRRSEALYGLVLAAKTIPELVAIPTHLDQLSDSLCRVLDLADFVRVSHCDTGFQDAATKAYDWLWEYMSVLNTTPNLKNKLEICLQTAAVAEKWNDEEHAVARILLEDFRNSAIDMPEASRSRFVELSTEIRRLGTSFVRNMTPATSQVAVRGEDLDSTKEQLRFFRAQRNEYLFPLGAYEAAFLLKNVNNAAMRKNIYVKSRQVCLRQISTLEKILKARQEVAGLSRCPSYAALNLKNKMADSPLAVTAFLETLLRDNKSLVAQELAELRRYKILGENSEHIDPWDVSFYQHRCTMATSGFIHGSAKPKEFFSLGCVMLGLSNLFGRLFGLSLVPSIMHEGESWGQDVRRIDVLDEKATPVAVLYCDFFNSANKSQNPAHYTLRSSRTILKHECISDDLFDNDGMARSFDSTAGELRQLPTIALVCSFEKSKYSHIPTLLSFVEVQTLFHEMGHALHSILGRTRFQVVSGTRCSTDFAEIPSVLMENFALDKDVLSTFARHWQSGQPLPLEMVDNITESQDRFKGLRTEMQIIYSLLDQAYHSSLPQNSDFDTSKLYHAIQRRYGSFEDPPECNPQGLFGHLFEYGGTYYSYLFDHAISTQIWHKVFASGRAGQAMNRESGTRLKDSLLKWGGARDPWKCIAELLEDDSLQRGGALAMEKVGRWRN